MEIPGFGLYSGFCYIAIVICRKARVAITKKSAHDILMRLGLSRYNVIAFVTIVDVVRAKEFYRDVLGLKLIGEESPYALVFDANGIMLRLGMAKERPPVTGTVLGWQVPDATAAVQELEEAGIRFERYDHLKQDTNGIWTAPTGAKVAWFKDPDGNILSISRTPGDESMNLLHRWLCSSRR